MIMANPAMFAGISYSLCVNMIVQEY